MWKAEAERHIKSTEILHKGNIELYLACILSTLQAALIIKEQLRYRSDLLRNRAQWSSTVCLIKLWEYIGLEHE
jgi:hypothetical protein